MAGLFSHLLLKNAKTQGEVIENNANVKGLKKETFICVFAGERVEEAAAACGA